MIESIADGFVIRLVIHQYEHKYFQYLHFLVPCILYP